jgi:hypothetical protein
MYYVQQRMAGGMSVWLAVGMLAGVVVIAVIVGVLWAACALSGRIDDEQDID